MRASLDHIDASKATEIAMGFLMQHHTIFDVRKPVLDDNGVWTVEVTASSLGNSNHIIKVKIDSKTGRIVGLE